MKTFDIPAVLIAAGVNVRVLDGWENIHIQNGAPYNWRESPRDPAGHIVHHTATDQYTPNRTKASGYAGLAIASSSRLWQDTRPGDFPVYVVANAYPAPVSAGAGVRWVLDDMVKQDIPMIRKQLDGDDYPKWYGNTHYWNTETILDGTGSPLDPRVFDMLVVVGQVLNDLFGWTSARTIGHGHHTRRKVDLWDGRYKDMNQTIMVMRAAIDETVIELPPVEPPPVDPPVPGGYVRPLLREGDGYVNGENPDVRGAVVGVQQQLAYHGHADRNTADRSKCAADGAFGTGTDTAVRSFQSAKQLVVDGIVGDMTYIELDKPKG